MRTSDIRGFTNTRRPLSSAIVSNSRRTISSEWFTKASTTRMGSRQKFTAIWMDGRGAHSTIPRPSEGRASVSMGRVTKSDAFVHPCVHLGQNPRDTIGAKPYPLREFTDRFEACDMLGCVWDASDGPQFLLRYEP